MSSPRQSSETNERSPLISPQHEPEDGSGYFEQHPLPSGLNYDVTQVESKSWWYLFLLTLSIGGLQIVWSVEFSNGSPYLLSLGMSKSLLAFVWIAGPLSGVLVQPYVGIRSDNCRISWGKRKPFMLGGGAGTIIALIALAWTREIVWGFSGLFGVAPESPGVKTTMIVVATIFMYVLDFAINTGMDFLPLSYGKSSLTFSLVQAGIRAFIVDNAPAHQQESANAWASRITGVGNVLGYVFGYINLPKHFPFFGNTQFKVLSLFASIALSSTLLISCLSIRERDPRLEGPPSNGNPGLFAFFGQVYASIRRMPPQIRKVCEVQFFSWIGWFPFLFYITTYIGQLYVNPYLKPNLSDTEIESLWEAATRVGTFALLISAITSFLANILLPFFVVPSYAAEAREDSPPTIAPTSPIGIRRRSSSFGELPFSASSANLSVYLPTETRRYTSPPQNWLSRALVRVQIPGLTLRRAWLLSQILFAICMFSTFLIRTPLAATIMATVLGIPWSLTLWAPFALISAEVAQRDEIGRKRLRRQGQQESSSETAEADAFKPDSDDNEEDEGPADQAGVILGLHNVAVSFPQILATLISSAVFKALQKPRGVPGDESVGWVLRIGGVAALVAAFFTSRLSESKDGA